MGGCVDLDMRRYITLLMLILLLMGSCASHTTPIYVRNNIIYSISSGVDPFISSNINTKEKSKYALLFNSDSDKDIDPMKEKKILFVLHEYFQKKTKWVKVDKKEADYLISVDFNIGETKLTGSQRVKTGNTVATNWDGTVKKDPLGKTKYKNTYDTKYYEYAANKRSFNIKVSNIIGDVIWSADVITTGKSNDIVYVAENILSSVMTAFPKDVSGEFAAGQWGGMYG